MVGWMVVFCINCIGLCRGRKQFWVIRECGTHIFDKMMPFYKQPDTVNNIKVKLYCPLVVVTIYQKQAESRIILQENTGVVGK